MAKLLTWFRLPALILGVALLFVAERYLGAETFHTAVRIAALALVAASLVATATLAALAAGRGEGMEAKGWRLLCLWQLAVLAGLGLYLGYTKVVGDATTPETPIGKVLLAAWALCLLLGAAAGIGGEWAHRASGLGVNAEPARVGRASLSWLAAGMLLAFLITLNYVGAKKDVQRDWSYLKVRTPSESTQKLMKTLTADLKINLYFPQGNEVRTIISDYFTALAQQEPRVKLAWYDKDTAPTQAEADRVSRNGQAVLDFGGKKSRIDVGTQLAKAKKTLKDLDSEFQKSFLEITAEKKTVYFSRGHGEFSWVGDASDNPLRSLRLMESYLKQQNYTTRLFGIAEGSATAVPDDASAVVVVGPTEPFQKEEVEALRAYVAKGGNLMVFLGTAKATGAAGTQEGEQPLLALLTEMGLSYTAVPLGNEKSHVAATHSESDIWFIYTNVFTSHESVVSLARHDERVALIVYQAGYWTIKPDSGAWKAFETVRTLSDTFADANRNFKFDPGEKRDTFVLGAVAERKDKKAAAAAPKAKGGRQGRVVAFADPTAISDALVRNIGNALYVSDSLKWLVGETELQGELASEDDVKIRHTRKEDVIWFHGTVVVVPLLVLGAGFLATRRKKTSGKETGDAA